MFQRAHTVAFHTGSSVFKPQLLPVGSSSWDAPRIYWSDYRSALGMPSGASGGSLRDKSAEAIKAS